jgi:hypothetical protein
MIRSYHDLCRHQSFEERYAYLKLGAAVGQPTFGFDRYANQLLYHSVTWKRIRDQVLIRDNGCYLGVPVYGGVLIHHINPITIENIENGDRCVFDLNNLISVSPATHQAIHFGDESKLVRLPKEREEGDTKLW